MPLLNKVPGGGGVKYNGVSRPFIVADGVEIQAGKPVTIDLSVVSNQETTEISKNFSGYIAESAELEDGRILVVYSVDDMRDVYATVVTKNGTSLSYTIPTMLFSFSTQYFAGNKIHIIPLKNGRFCLIFPLTDTYSNYNGAAMYCVSGDTISAVTTAPVSLQSHNIGAGSCEHLEISENTYFVKGKETSSAMVIKFSEANEIQILTEPFSKLNTPKAVSGMMLLEDGRILVLHTVSSSSTVLATAIVSISNQTITIDSDTVLPYSDYGAAVKMKRNTLLILSYNSYKPGAFSASVEGDEVTVSTLNSMIKFSCPLMFLEKPWPYSYVCAGSSIKSGVGSNVGYLYELKERNGWVTFVNSKTPDGINTFRSFTITKHGDVVCFFYGGNILYGSVVMTARVYPANGEFSGVAITGGQGGEIIEVLVKEED